MVRQPEVIQNYEIYCIYEKKSLFMYSFKEKAQLNRKKMPTISRYIISEGRRADHSILFTIN